MSAKGELPEELLEFLRLDGGHSLIVHGEPGTGKTTLALQLIEALDAEQNTLYISTRVSDMSLYLQFPWLRERARRNRLLMDARSFLRSLSAAPNSEEVRNSALALLDTLSSRGAYEMPDTVARTELKKLEGDIEGLDVDSEMYDDESLVFDLGSDMPEIDLAYDSVEGALPRRSLVIFDSIDALSEKYGVPANKLVTSVQKDLVENSGANVVYILESAGTSHIDYLGDGVIHMNSAETEGRRYRETIISKLRGYEIKHHRHIITLSGGRIYDITIRERPHVGPGMWRLPGKFLTDGRYSTGNSDIDAVLGGGLSPSEVLLIEISSQAAREYADEIVYRMIAAFASEGHGVSWLPSRRRGREEIVKRMDRDISFERIEKNIQLLEYGREESINRYLGNRLEGKDVQTDLDWGGVEYSLRGRKVPFLSVIGMDTLQAIYGKDAPLQIFEHIGAVKHSEGIFVMLVGTDDEHISRLSAIAEHHLVVDMLHNAPVIYGKKPFTCLYGMIRRVKDKSIVLKLIPIS